MDNLLPSAPVQVVALFFSLISCNIMNFKPKFRVDYQASTRRSTKIETALNYGKLFFSQNFIQSYFYNTESCLIGRSYHLMQPGTWFQGAESQQGYVYFVDT